MRILVVDDSEDSRGLTEGALLSAGYANIVTAASGWEALKVLDIGRTTDDHPPVDIVLLDIIMPEMDGVEVCARIRNDPRFADLPIIMVTSLDDMDSLSNAFVAGATDYVTKPINRIELAARVRAALRLKQELDRRRTRERELLSFLSSWGDRRAGIWIDEATGLFVGEVAEAYLTRATGPADDLVSVIALTLDGFETTRTANAEQADNALAQVGRAVRRLTATVGVVAAAYRNGMIIVVAPDLGLNSARELAETLHATVRKLRLGNSEPPIASDYITASVAAISGRIKRDVDRIQLLTQAISRVQQAEAVGGNRVLAVNVEGGMPKSSGRVAEKPVRAQEVGTPA
jgi:phosphoserine phosphatase RsbU/P